MKQHNIEAVILYSANEIMFHDLCVSNLLSIGIKVHIITYSYMWEGDYEDIALLDLSHKKFKDNADYRHTHLEWQPGMPLNYWEAMGRYVGTQKALPDTEYLLYIDIDEIIEPAKFKRWLDTGRYRKFISVFFRAYGYYQLPIYRLKHTSTSAILAKKKFAKSVDMKLTARAPYFTVNRFKRILAKIGINPTLLILKSEIFIHHYSFVRTLPGVVNKLNNTPHRKEAEAWMDDVVKNFSHPFNDETVVMSFDDIDVVENLFNIQVS